MARTPEEQLQNIDHILENIKEQVADDYGGFGELRKEAKQGNQKAKELLDDYDQLRAGRDKIAKNIGGFS